MVAGPEKCRSFMRQTIGGRILVFFVMCLVAMYGVAASTNVAHAAPLYSNYSCSQRCELRADWAGNVSGASTDITLGFITCGTCDGFIDNEMWVVDEGNKCPYDNPCWVETGYSTYTPSNSLDCVPGQPANCYFWADQRPGSGGYNEHTLGGNVRSDEYGHTSFFQIFQSTPSTWNVTIIGYDPNDKINGYSTNNAISPNDISIGQELSGTHGAGAALTKFTFNQWASGGGSFQAQSGDGVKYVNPTNGNPLSGGWSTRDPYGTFCTDCSAGW